MRSFLSWIVCFHMALIGCTFSDDERCVKGFKWENHTCVKIPDIPDPVDSGDRDAATGDIEGLGFPCKTMGVEECKKFVDPPLFCATYPGAPGGYCTTQDCTPGGNDCPDGYQCCRPHVTIPYLCLTEEDYGKLSATCPGK